MCLQVLAGTLLPQRLAKLCCYVARHNDIILAVEGPNWHSLQGQSIKRSPAMEGTSDDVISLSPRSLSAGGTPDGATGTAAAKPSSADSRKSSRSPLREPSLSLRDLLSDLQEVSDESRLLVAAKRAPAPPIEWPVT